MIKVDVQFNGYSAMYVQCGVWDLRPVVSLQVCLWLGKGANPIEKDAAVTTAQEYLRSHPGGRDVDTPIVLIKQGFEPPTFTGWFHAWDPQKWSVRNSWRTLTER